MSAKHIVSQFKLKLSQTNSKNRKGGHHNVQKI